MRMDDEFLFENILKTFFKLEQNITRLWWLPPKQITSLLDAQYYLFQLLWFGIGKLQEEEEPRQDLWSSRKKISIDHVAPQVGQKYQTMIEHMYTVLTWNTYSLSLSTVFQNNFARLELLLGYLSTSLSFVAANSILDRFRSELLLSYLYCNQFVVLINNLLS